jgi:hypothetical protein
MLSTHRKRGVGASWIRVSKTIKRAKDEKSIAPVLQSFCDGRSLIRLLVLRMCSLRGDQYSGKPRLAHQIGRFGAGSNLDTPKPTNQPTMAEEALGAMSKATLWSRNHSRLSTRPTAELQCNIILTQELRG